VSYTYERGGRRIAKRVSFFLFEYRDGNLADHDHEIEDAQWMPLAEAAEQLSYVGEREMVRRVLSCRAEDR
jgi:NADH pyrophosphatase NudC (nudix superfamily)